MTMSPENLSKMLERPTGKSSYGLLSGAEALNKKPDTVFGEPTHAKRVSKKAARENLTVMGGGSRSTAKAASKPASASDAGGGSLSSSSESDDETRQARAEELRSQVAAALAKKKEKRRRRRAKARKAREDEEQQLLLKIAGMQLTGDDSSSSDGAGGGDTVDFSALLAKGVTCSFSGTPSVDALGKKAARSMGITGASSIMEAYKKGGRERGPVETRMRSDVMESTANISKRDQNEIFTLAWIIDTLEAGQLKIALELLHRRMVGVFHASSLSNWTVMDTLMPSLNGGQLLETGEQASLMTDVKRLEAFRSSGRKGNKSGSGKKGKRGRYRYDDRPPPFSYEDRRSDYEDRERDGHRRYDRYGAPSGRRDYDRRDVRNYERTPRGAGRGRR